MDQLDCDWRWCWSREFHGHPHFGLRRTRPCLGARHSLLSVLPHLTPCNLGINPMSVHGRCAARHGICTRLRAASTHEARVLCPRERPAHRHPPHRGLSATHQHIPWPKQLRGSLHSDLAKRHCPPAPLYLRPADAAPARDAPPKIIA